MTYTKSAVLPVSPGHVAGGTFREVEPGERVVFGWGWEGDDSLPPDTSTVTLTIEPTGDGTRVTLEHAGRTEEQAVHHAMGWDHHFERLQRAAVDGDAGPDEWAAAPENLDPLSGAEATLAVLQGVLRKLTTECRPGRRRALSTPATTWSSTSSGRSPASARWPAPP